MKMKPLFILLFLTISGSLFADLYLRGGLYYASSEDISVKSTEDFVTSAEGNVGFNIAAGYQLSYFRLEGEFSTLSRDVGGVSSDLISAAGSLDRNSVFANILFEFPATPFIEPYVGAGVGLSQLDFSMQSGITVGGQEFEFSGAQDDTVLSFQLMAGLRFSLRDNFSIYAGYRYFSTESIAISETGYSVDADNATGLVELGVGFGF